MLQAHEYVSTNVSLKPPTIALGWASWSLKIDSITDNSVAVVSSPAKATQLQVRKLMRPEDILIHAKTCTDDIAPTIHRPAR